MNIDGFKKPGFVYILINPSLQQNMLKIGMTTRSPEERAAELSRGTGVPTPFFVAFKVYSSNCEALENLVHQRLDSFRYKKNREFFKLDLAVCIETLRDENQKLEDLYAELALILPNIDQILELNYDRVTFIEGKYNPKTIQVISEIFEIIKDSQSQGCTYLLCAMTRLLMTCTDALNYYCGDHQISLFHEPSLDEIHEISKLQESLYKCLEVFFNCQYQVRFQILSKAIHFLLYSTNLNYQELMISSLLYLQIDVELEDITYDRIRYISKFYSEDNPQSLQVSTLSYKYLLVNSLITENDLESILKFIRSGYDEELQRSLFTTILTKFNYALVKQNYLENEDLIEILNDMILHEDEDDLIDRLEDSLDEFLRLLNKYIINHDTQISKEFLHSYLTLIVAVCMNTGNEYLSASYVKDHILDLTYVLFRKDIDRNFKTSLMKTLDIN